MRDLGAVRGTRFTGCPAVDVAFDPDGRSKRVARSPRGTSTSSPASKPPAAAPPSAAPHPAAPPAVAASSCSLMYCVACAPQNGYLEATRRIRIEFLHHSKVVTVLLAAPLVGEVPGATGLRRRTPCRPGADLLDARLPNIAAGVVGELRRGPRLLPVCGSHLIPASSRRLLPGGRARARGGGLRGGGGGGMPHPPRRLRVCLVRQAIHRKTQ